MIEKENIAGEHNTKKEKKKKKKKKKAATFGLNFENRQLKEQEEDYETQTKRQRLEHYREQFPQHQEREATIFVAGVEEDEEEDDDLEDGIVQLQQSQDSEQGFCELSSFVHELLEAPRTATTTATTTKVRQSAEDLAELEEMSEEQMLNRYFRLTGFEPQYADVYELRTMLASESRGHARNAMMGGNNDTGGLERTASGELKLQI